MTRLPRPPCAAREARWASCRKRSAPEALLEAVYGGCGRPPLSRTPRFAQKLALAEFDGGTKSPVERLSEREFEVFVRLSGGADGASASPWI